MGTNSSKVEVESTNPSDTTFFSSRTSPVQFSNSLINHLSSSSTTSSDPNAPSSSRQETLDSHIQSRINQELLRLKEEEQEVKLEIEKALERENLSKESGSSAVGGGEGEGVGISHSVSLMRDLEELEKRTQAKREESKKDLESGVWAEVEGGRLSLSECLLQNRKTPLNCKATAQSFLHAVSKVEGAFANSLI